MPSRRSSPSPAATAKKRKPPGKQRRAGRNDTAIAARVELFIAAYLSNNLNGTQAAVTAGYAPSHAYLAGLRMLKRPEVKAKIAERVQAITARYEVTPENVIREAARIAFSDPIGLVDESGNRKPLELIDENTRRAIASVKKGGEVKFHDKVAGLNTLAKYLRILPTGGTVNVQAIAQSAAAAEVKQISAEKRSTLEIGRRIAFALELAAREAEANPTPELLIAPSDNRA